MNVFSRGVRNAFRNGIRTFSIVIILGISVGLALTMLVARSAVETKIAAVKSGIGTTISISPAGFTPGSNANNALTTDELRSVKSLPHITALDETLSDRLSTTGSSMPSFGFGRSSSSSSSTSLTSPITLDSTNSSHRIFISGGGDTTAPTNFSLPISFLGTSNPAQVNGNSITITTGTIINGSVDSNNALISQNMASKNNLKVGSTFTAYQTTLTVAGIFSSDNQSAEDTVVVSLPALQRLGGQPGVITSATATVDSLDNLSSATTAVKNNLGSSADVTSSEEQADSTVAPLNSVKTVTLYSLIGALIAGSVIILLTMMMIVRERRREIGVMKAIGSSNLKTTIQFIIESVTLTLLGLIIGLIIAVTSASPITNALVSNSTTSQTSPTAPGQAMRRSGAFGGGTFRNFGGNFSRFAGASTSNFKNIQASVGWSTLGYGILVALIIAIVGSAIPAYFISKVRPSDVIRAE